MSSNLTVATWQKITLKASAKKLMCDTPISINFRRQIEKQMSNYWLMGASSFKF